MARLIFDKIETKSDYIIITSNETNKSITIPKDKYNMLINEGIELNEFDFKDLSKITISTDTIKTSPRYDYNQNQEHIKGSKKFLDAMDLNVPKKINEVSSESDTIYVRFQKDDWSNPDIQSIYKHRTLNHGELAKVFISYFYNLKNNNGLSSYISGINSSDVSYKFDLSNVYVPDDLTDLSYFSQDLIYSRLYKNISALPNINFNRVINAKDAFINFYSLKSIGDLDITNCLDTTSMFENCESLTNVGDIKINNNAICDKMFYNCPNLKRIGVINMNLLPNDFIKAEHLENIKYLPHRLIDCIDVPDSCHIITDDLNYLMSKQSFENVDCIVMDSFTIKSNITNVLIDARPINFEQKFDLNVKARLGNVDIISIDSIDGYELIVDDNPNIIDSSLEYNNDGTFTVRASYKRNKDTFTSNLHCYVTVGYTAKIFEKIMQCQTKIDYVFENAFNS